MLTKLIGRADVVFESSEAYNADGEYEYRLRLSTSTSTKQNRCQNHPVHRSRACGHFQMDNQTSRPGDGCR